MEKRRMNRTVAMALRVATRYAAKAMTEEKFREFLLKIRKGTITSLSYKHWVEVLGRLGGWAIEGVVALQSDQRLDEVETFSNASLATIEWKQERVRDGLVSSLPTNPIRNKRYYMDLTEPAETANGYEITFRSWFASDAIRFTSPEGKIYEFFGGTLAPPHELAAWLIGSTKVQEQASAVLGMATHQKEREEAKPRTRDGTGTCPCCFANIKLKERGSQPPVMVLHGYKRPGRGSVHGRCLCVGFPPFELSREGTQHVLKLLESSHENRISYLDQLESGAITRIETTKTVKVGDPDWMYILKRQIEKTRDEIRETVERMKRAQKLIATWKPNPLPVKDGESYSFGHIF